MDYLDLRMLTLYIGLFDAKRGSDNLEVSYTKFHDHFKVSLRPNPPPLQKTISIN